MGSPNLQLLMGQQAGAVAPPGEVEFVDHPGGQSQQWTVPLGVKSVSIVLVGGGAGADGGNNGSGGGLTWINNVPVTAGTNLTVKNGKTGSRFGSGNPSGSDTNGQSSTVHDASGNLIAQAEGGKKAQSNSGGSGGNESYNIGSNHILPTNGSAKYSSGLSVNEFYKRISYINLSKKGIESLGPSVITLANYEKLAGHAQSIKRRIRRK